MVKGVNPSINPWEKDIVNQATASVWNTPDSLASSWDSAGKHGGKMPGTMLEQWGTREGQWRKMVDLSKTHADLQLILGSLI